MSNLSVPAQANYPVQACLIDKNTAAITKYLLYSVDNRSSMIDVIDGLYSAKTADDNISPVFIVAIGLDSGGKWWGVAI